MARTYDAEDLLDSVKQVMTDNTALNTKIAAIETEKGALSPTLASVNSGSYYEQTWTNKILQSNPAIFYGIEDVQSLENAGAVAKTYKVFVEVILVDNGQTNDIHKRIWRYSRALEELFCAAYDKAISAGRVKVEAVRPISAKLELDTDDEIKIGGVLLTITLV